MAISPKVIIIGSGQYTRYLYQQPSKVRGLADTRYEGVAGLSLAHGLTKVCMTQTDICIHRLKIS